VNWLAMIDAHLPVLPVLLPSLTATVMLLAGDQSVAQGNGRSRLAWIRRLALSSAVLGLIMALQLFLDAQDGVLRVYRLGDWPAPFGIVLVIDRLSAFMLLLTQVVALPVLWYATGGWDAHGRYFHAMFQFQLMGLGGAFITGDLFNLFVFFEVLLIASYVLLVHGQGRDRFRVGVHFVVLNLMASALFLIGVALIYALTGTLNMADLALRVPMVPAPESALLQVAALMLLVVFGFKAALLPLHMWLPATYAAASPPVAALFAIMTKVGVYSILRVQGVIFGADAGAAAFTAMPWILPLALGTCLFGVMGALAAHTLSRLVACLTVSSVGTALAAVGLFSAAGWSAALYYSAQSTLVMAGLFLLAELVAAQRGDAADRLEPAAPVAQPVLLGALLLLGAASAAGLPPLPGFIGKLLLLQASAGTAAQVWVWAIVLLAGLLAMIGLARAGSILFWHVNIDDGAPHAGRSGASVQLVFATTTLFAAAIAMSVFAAPLKAYTDAAALQLMDRAAYARAVLAEQGGEQADTARRYRFDNGGKGE